jgi:hypothetical protein
MITTESVVFRGGLGGLHAAEVVGVTAGLA